MQNSFSTTYIQSSLHSPSQTISLPNPSSMAATSVCDINGDKENIPSSSSVQPAVANPAVHSNKKRKSRTPLEDITNLLYPENVPSPPEAQLVSEISASSQLSRARFSNQLENRRKKARTSATLRNSNTSAVTLRKHFR
ncbi:hypothetical protein CASFOL_030880 [Castilleja foliolosa]|uniref:Uncharacterized protein n=1 Tax=Castilleja foliolosa TaxID=1961234 RepID=A0ABD3C7W5_9LAMI